MVRPRHEPIELIAQGEKLEDLKEKVSRRRMMQLAGAGGASFVAGCGGGGGEASPTATATEAQDTPTPTEAGGMDTETPTPTEAEGMDTPTETETETETVSTPAGDIEMVDRNLQSISQLNFAQATPNPWNSENAYLPAWMNSELLTTPETMSAPPDARGVDETAFPDIAKSVELDPKNNQVNYELQSDPPVTFGSGQTINVDQVFRHWDLLQAQVEMGEADESTIPLSWSADGEFSFTSTLLPGNPQIRFFTATFGGSLNSVANTHPVLHKEYIQRVRDATTTSAIQKVFQDLFAAKFPKSALPKIASGPFMPTDWNPSRIIYEARTDYPWGLSQPVGVDRMFKGVKDTFVPATEQGAQNEINATINNKQDFFTVNIERTFNRFPDGWQKWELSEATGTTLWFQPGSAGKKNFGAKTEKHRRRRKGVTALFDNNKVSQVNDLKNAYEQTMGFYRKLDYEAYVADSEELWEDFGDADSGYVKSQKGKQYLRQDHSKNKNGYWVDDESGDVLTAEVFLGTDAEGGITEPVLRSIPEQLNDIGVKATGKLVGGEQFSNATTQRKGDMIFSSGNCEMHPHPYFGYREDCGIGSTEGLPVGLWWGDWHNGYRRVKVPFPVGNPDGALGTFDWDKNVLEMAELPPGEMDKRIETLSWVLNQWVPGIYTLKTSAFPVMNTNRLQPTDAWSDPTLLNKPEGLYGAGELWPFVDISIANMLALGVLEPA